MLNGYGGPKAKHHRFDHITVMVSPFGFFPHPPWSAADRPSHHSDDTSVETGSLRTAGARSDHLRACGPAALVDDFTIATELTSASSP